jgi:hypothetical protein
MGVSEIRKIILILNLIESHLMEMYTKELQNDLQVDIRTIKN